MRFGSKLVFFRAVYVEKLAVTFRPFPMLRNFFWRGPPFLLGFFNLPDQGWIRVP
jgi:hypothetical protein